ncbi:MAG: FKBP-type peptidyl-prolyl cis-trans isomerase [Microbacteriaceae bacterium]
MKRHIALVATVVVAAATLSLTACSGSASADCFKVAAGSASNAVQTGGDFGGKTTVTVESAVTATGLERSVVTKGDGELPKTGEKIDVMLSIFSATTGDTIDALSTTLSANDSTMPEPLRAAVDCMPVGTRTVTVFPGTDLYSTSELEKVGLSATDSIILVADVVSVQKDPEVGDWTTGAPTVTFDSAGIPTIDLSTATQPDGLAVKVLKEGSGATVTSTDTVKVQYYGVSWADGISFDSNYGEDPTELQLSGVITGFRLGLVGQKVGSQLLVSIPAKYAYGEGTASSSNKLAGYDLLFLIDIVSVTAAK